MIVLAAAIAHADPKQDAKPHIEKAMVLHGEQKWAEALAELTTAYAIDPQPDLLFGMGQLEVKLGNCDQAIQYYQRYLLSGPDAGPVAATNEAINTCRKKLAIDRPSMTTPPPAEPEKSAPSAPARWYGDPIGGLLVGAGVITGALGILMYRSARGDIDAAERASSYQGGLDLVASAHTKRTIAAAMGIAGIGLVGGGVARYVLHAQTTETLAIAPARGGGIVSWCGTW